MADTVTYTSDAGSSETIIAQEITRFSVGGVPNIRKVSFDIDFEASNSIVATINAVAMGVVLFDVDHSTTMAALIARLEQNIAITSVVLVGTDERILEITGQDGIELVVTSIITTSGANQAVGTISELQQETVLTKIHLRNREEILSTDSVATLVALLP